MFLARASPAHLGATLPACTVAPQSSPAGQAELANTTSVSLLFIVHASLLVTVSGPEAVSKLQVCCASGQMSRAAGSGRQPAQSKRNPQILRRRLTAFRAWPPQAGTAGTASDWARPCPSLSCRIQRALCSPVHTGWHALDQCACCQAINRDHRPCHQRDRAVFKSGRHNGWAWD